MGKLRLEIEALQVDSFGTGPEAGARGTVRGNDQLVLTTPIIVTFLETCLTCNAAQNTCYYDCNTQEEDLSCRPSCLPPPDYYDGTCRQEDVQVGVLAE
ncbi:MAG TPA: hypothetical protein VFT11_04255 [Candidatus Deferrimicrobiaceae bacterium]|nr:hypothetical protein [Candidatus Deferrimicrobiaceae bacterium]